MSHRIDIFADEISSLNTVNLMDTALRCHISESIRATLVRPSPDEPLWGPMPDEPEMSPYPDGVPAPPKPQEDAPCMHP